MAATLSLRPLVMDVWLIELLLKHEGGLSFEEIKRRWREYPQHEGSISRSTLVRHRHMIESFFGIVINSPDKRRYRIANPDALKVNSLANDLLASLQNYLFLDEYRDLGDAIQPEKILCGLEYLRPIGEAIRYHHKLHVVYQKFSDSEPYEAILQPYCLKASLGRWYILAFKEQSEHPVQTFALDRILSLHTLSQSFTPSPEIDPSTYFHDCFGVWRDYESFPVCALKIEAAPHVAHYLRTLPLHHSQREVSEGCFTFHISPSPDFLGELKRWGEDVKIVEEGNEEK